MKNYTSTRRTCSCFNGHTFDRRKEVIFLFLWLSCAYEIITYGLQKSSWICRHSGGLCTLQVPFPSLMLPVFVKADDHKELENRARFVLDAANRRWGLFQSAIIDHYNTNTPGAISSLEVGEENKEGGFQNKGESLCIYHSPITDIWYQLCLGKYVRRYDSRANSVGNAANDKEGETDDELLEVDSAQMEVRLERSYYYNWDGDKHNQEEYIAQLEKDWDGHNIEESTQSYVSGDLCPDPELEFHSSRVKLEGCCSHWEGAEDERTVIGSFGTLNVLEFKEENACKIFFTVCSVCSVDPPASTDDTTSDEESILRKQRKMMQDKFLYQTDKQKRARKNEENSGSNLQKMQELLPDSFPPMPGSRVSSNIKMVTSMFQHAYDSYMYHAYPGSELKPLSCNEGVFHLVRLPALTLIDSLDMLLIMNNYTEFARSVERLRLLDDSMRPGSQSSSDKGGIFAVDEDVSLFETNIRVLGGLLSAHQMAEISTHGKVLKEHVFGEDSTSVLIGENKDSDETCTNEKHRAGSHHISKPVCSDQKGGGICSQSDGIDSLEKESLRTRGLDQGEKVSNGTNGTNETDAADYWVYDGFLLELAHDIGKRLLPAFETETGIPYGTVNLLSGIPKGETTIASLAGAGTVSIEMELLSRLTNDERFGKAAKLSTRALFSRRSSLGLLGKHIDVKDGLWTETLSGIGSNSDSIYEYLIKHHILFPEDEDFFAMFHATHAAIYKNGKIGDWYPDVPMKIGISQASSVFESLAAFYPGMQILLGELNPAARSTNAFTTVREYVSFLPERFDFVQFEPYYNHQTYPLRPELYESNYFLHLATKNLGLGQPTSGWLWNADFFLHALENTAKTNCGYATIKGITSKQDKKLFLGDEMPSFFLSETLKYLYLTFDEDNFINTDKERNWIFTTEAHPVHSVPAIRHYRSNDRQKGNETAKMENDWLDDSKVEILTFLDDLISSNNSAIDAMPTLLDDSSPMKYLHKEKWTMQTGKFPHMKDLQKISAGLPVNSHEQTTGRMMHDSIVGVHMGPKEGNTLNFAYLTHGKNGRGAALEKSCPNYYQSNSLWIQAMAGEELDFAQTFEPTRTNERKHLTTKPKLPSALAASALYGTSYFSGDTNKCRKEKQKIMENKSSTSGSETRAGSQRLDMGDMGSFDISLDSTGAGYFVRHLESGETIEVTIVQSQPSDSKGQKQDTFAAVDAFIVKETEEDKSSLLSQFKSVFKSISYKKQKTKRHVYIADMDNHSYECVIELKHATNESEVMANKGTYETIRDFPCLPASYGPSSIVLLNEVGVEINFEAEIFKPDNSDPFGCHKDWEEEDETCHVEDNEQEDFLSVKTCRKPRIQLVHRGKCNFQAKGINQGSRFNAKGLIVVNTDSRKLFIMSGPMSKDEQKSANKNPLSVLVTKEDGAEMIKLLEQYDSEDKSIIASIRIIPQTVQVESLGVAEQSKSIEWPLIQTSENQIHVYASQGWGIGATKDEKDTWQIMLLQHSYGS